ncbi:MAG: carbon monoxide dehydrogenase [Paucimonas sp.]|nr:carbon monoxide dehydrogenase [Paucimonas sp.]
MYTFSYKKAGSVDDAIATLADNEEAKVLAGGMSLLPTMKLRLSRPQQLIDLKGLGELSGIALRDGSLVIGAMTTHYAVSSSELVLEALPALASLAGGIGDVQVRYRGTIGGSVANCDPAADYPAAVLALNAKIVTNQREIDADQFFVGLFETALRQGEIITAFRFPLPASAAYVKFANMASRFAIVGVFLARFEDGVRIAVTGAADSVFRLSDYEAALSRRFDVGSLRRLSVPKNGLLADIHATAEYRAHLVSTLARRAAEQAGATCDL